MFALPISKPLFKGIIFYNQNSPKIKLFLQKNAKFSGAGGSAPDPGVSSLAVFPQIPNLRRLGASPPDPQNSPPPLRISGYAPGL